MNAFIQSFVEAKYKVKVPVEVPTPSDRRRKFLTNLARITFVSVKVIIFKLIYSS